MKIESKDKPRKYERLQNSTLVNYNIEENTRVDLDNTVSVYYSYEQDKIQKDATEELIDKTIAKGQIRVYKQYLKDTDWIIVKINEAKVLGQDIQPMLDKYSEELTKRQEYRKLV